MCHMALKKKAIGNEKNSIGFHLHSMSALQMQNLKRAFNCHFTGALHRNIFFSQKNWKQMCIGKSIGHWEMKSTWIRYMVKLIFKFFCPIYIQGCPVLMLAFCTLWGSWTNVQNTMSTFVGCVSFDKKQYSISKDNCCL